MASCACTNCARHLWLQGSYTENFCSAAKCPILIMSNFLIRRCPICPSKACLTERVAVSCLGRCDLPKHRCIDREEIRPGPVPSHMGWLYTAKDSPEHQLRCGWRPGHIFCPVLREVEANSYSKCSPCPKRSSCRPGPRYCVIPFPPVRSSRTVCNKCTIQRCNVKCSPRSYPYASRTSCSVPCPPRRRCRHPLKCLDPMCTKCFPGASRKCCHPSCPPSACYQPCELPCSQPMLRIIRHNGEYSIITKPDDITNHPSGPYPLKYVLNTDAFSADRDCLFTIEAKFNDQVFDYKSSQTSFVLDFSPPDPKCTKPCPRKSTVCFPCQNDEGRAECPQCAPKPPPPEPEPEPAPPKGCKKFFSRSKTAPPPPPAKGAPQKEPPPKGKK